MTGWGALLIVASLVLGLGTMDRKRAYRRGLCLTAVVVLAVGLGVL